MLTLAQARAEAASIAAESLMVILSLAKKTATDVARGDKSQVSAMSLATYLLSVMALASCLLGLFERFLTGSRETSKVGKGLAS